MPKGFGYPGLGSADLGWACSMSYSGWASSGQIGDIGSVPHILSSSRLAQVCIHSLDGDVKSRESPVTHVF